MNYNRKKVNFIIFALIILIAMVTIFAAVDLTEEQDISNPSVVAEDEASSESGDESQKAEETKVELIKAPTFSSGWAALNYALEIAEKNDFEIINTDLDIEICKQKIANCVDKKLTKQSNGDKI